MGWHKFTKSLGHGVDGLSGFIGGSGTSFGQWAGDFKDWFDGTDAMRKQNDLNVQNWNMVNAYNTPAMQMARFKEAGLNPNLIYSQTNTAGQIASAGMPESGSSQLGKAASSIAQMYGLKNMAAQNANLHAQNDLLHTQADYTNAQVERMKYDTNWLKKNGVSSFSMPEERLFESVSGRVKPYWDGFVDMVTGNSLRASEASRLATERYFKDLNKKYTKEKKYDKLLSDRYFNKRPN